MRDIFLIIAILLGLGVTLRHPFAGVLLWTWFSIMAPHEEAFGFAKTIPLNLTIVAVTTLSWIISKEPKKIPTHPVVILTFVFLLWVTFNSFFAFDPDWSWRYWDRTWRIFALGLVLVALTTNKARLDSIVAVCVISLFYYGVKGGVFTLVTGGQNTVYGPPDTVIADNNQLALALLMSIPLAEYLRTTVSSRILSYGIATAMALVGIAVLGSYSRGAYIALAALALFGWFKSKRKLLYLIIATVFVVPAIEFMPKSFFDRVNTLSSISTDASFHGRWIAWQVAYRYAVDHFPFGAGFYAPQLPQLFNSYFPTESAHAAHSIYFQVLGEHGFVGLTIYLLILFVTYASYSRFARRTALPSGSAWAAKFAAMAQLSLIAFAVGGAALSMAYYDLFIVLIFLVPVLGRIAVPQIEATPHRS